MSEQTDVRRLLVLHGPALESQGILGFLREHFEIHVTGELADALAAMREQEFAAVLAETADFLPLERGVVTQQAAAVLDTIGDGVCIVGPDGQLVWANRRMREFPEPLLDELRGLCVRAYAEFAAAGETLPDRGRRFSLMPDDQSYFEVICSPVLDRRGRLRQVAAVAVNATSRRRQQQKMNAIDRAGRELLSLQRETVAQRDAVQRLQMLGEMIVRCSRDVLNYEHFAVLLLEEQTNRLEVLIAEGLDEQASMYELLADAEGNGICGYVAATGRSYICPDVRIDRRYLPGLAGAGSSLTVPLRLHDRIVGVLNVESRQFRAFTEEDRQFAEIFATYVALALNTLNLLVTERHKAHTQVSGSISAELAGPINDLIADVGELMEDYIGHDDLRRRLGQALDRAAQVRRSIQQLSESPDVALVTGLPATARKDPLLAGKRVLVADDERAIRSTLRDVLAGCGCEVAVAADGAEALALIARETYDLIISDIKMPGADGYEVFSAAKARRPSTPVILITAFGYDPNHSILRARQEGQSALLLKPFKVEQLLAQCRAALTGPSAG
jgi:CheY-like chemotaxis protein